MYDSNWRELYEAAALETDTTALSMRIELAEMEISRRLQAMESEFQRTEEREALTQALSSLQTLKSEAQKWREESHFRSDSAATS